MSFFDSLDYYVGGAFDTVGSVTDRVINYGSSISDFLDYGDDYDESGNGLEARQNPEVNTTEIDRSNPYGLPSNKTIMIYGGAALGVVLLLLVVRK